MVLKGVLQVKMLIKAGRTDLILQGKYVGKIDTKDLLAHLGVCPQDYRAISCYGHSKDPFFGSREDSGQVVQLRESQKSCVLTAAEMSRFFFCFHAYKMCISDLLSSSVYYRMPDFHFGTKYRGRGSRGHFDHYALEIL